MAGEDTRAGLPGAGLIFGLRICWALQSLSAFSAAACGAPAWERLVTAGQLQEVASESAAAAGAATAEGDCQQNLVRREELSSCSWSSPGL